MLNISKHLKLPAPTQMNVLRKEPNRSTGMLTIAEIIGREVPTPAKAPKFKVKLVKWYNPFIGLMYSSECVSSNGGVR